MLKADHQWNAPGSALDQWEPSVWMRPWPEIALGWTDRQTDDRIPHEILTRERSKLNPWFWLMVVKLWQVWANHQPTAFQLRPNLRFRFNFWSFGQPTWSGRDLLLEETSQSDQKVEKWNNCSSNWSSNRQSSNCWCIGLTSGCQVALPITWNWKLNYKLIDTIFGLYC